MQQDRILVVDDDPSWQELLRESIAASAGRGQRPRVVRVASALAEAEALLDRQHFHLAFVDLRLREDARDLEGRKLVQKLVALDEGVSIVIVTGHADVNTAITALKEWRVLDFVLKDAWEPDKVARLTLEGLAAARERYRQRYESAIDFLRGDQEIYPWVATALDVLAPDARTPRPERLLGDFLNALLADLYPLLPQRERLPLFDRPAAAINLCCWSKALGSPVAIRLGRHVAETHRTDRQAAGCAFASIARVVADEQLGIEGMVLTPAAPPFDALETRQAPGA